MQKITYSADPPEIRQLVMLDELYVLYHRTSGITHIVTDPVPQILAALDAGPADAALIMARLAHAFDIDPSADNIAIVAARLQELEAIGLVSRI